jgi:aspartyl-tRNA(Asn)/glutamyl-tRNA(Gln) amidotransferase subunit A
MTIHELSVRQLRDKLGSRDLSRVEVVEHYLARIDALNPGLNAFVHVDADAAVSRARELDSHASTGEPVGPLAGLPVAIKDNICQKGVVASCGSRMMAEFRPPYDAHVVQQIERDGGILIGRLNLDEFAMGSSSETSVFGAVHNPWDRNRTAGGSSGGAAAAVSAGLVPLAIGSDTGGSIRQPASFCGVTGFKPTYGRVSRYGLVAYGSSLDQIGPFSRDADGCRLLLQTIAGHDVRDSTSLTTTSPSEQNDAAFDVSGITIGIVDEHYGEGLDPDVSRVTLSAIDQLKQAGAKVRHIRLPHARYCVATYYLIACSEASSNLARYDGIHYGHRAESYDDLVGLYCQSRGVGFGAEVKRRIMLGTFALSAGYYEAFYLKALKVRRRIREDFDAAFQDVDVIAGPVAPTTAFELGANLDDPLAMYLGDIHTLSANLAGIPAMSVPCGSCSAGMPIGLQLMAAPLNEAVLLQVAGEFQQMTGWHQSAPLLDG